MRNGGVVFALGSLLGHVFLLRESRKNLIACTACILVPALIVSNILFPALDITPGSKREILSIPFQQIARTVSQYPDDLTEEESSAIDTVLGIASLAERYDPNLSDRVKDGFNKHATVEDMASFWKAWLSLGLRHPAAYLSATANNYYGYFYLTDKDNEFYSLEWSKMCMESIPSFDFHQADNPAVRAFAWLNVSYDEIFNKVAPLSLFMSCPLYVWALILATLRAAYLKNRRLLALLISPWLIFLICLIGPANGISYFRYIFPVALSMPFLVGILFSPSGHDRRQLSRESHRSRPVASSF